MKDLKSIAINSLLLYIIAFLSTTMIHELAHAIAGMLFNSEPVLHNNYVEHLASSHLSIKEQVTIALAGPLTSLLQGILSGLAYLKSKKYGLGRLFLLWLSILGLFNFLGYLMTGPLFQQGDIGKAFQLLNTPLFVQVLIAITGALILVVVAYKLTNPFLRFGYKPEWLETPSSRQKFSFHIIIIPWLIGSMIMTTLYLPIIAIVSIIYPVMSGMIFIFPWQNAATSKNIKVSTCSGIGRFSIPAITILLLLIMVFKIILQPGISL